MKALLLELADAVQRAVGQIAEDPGEVLGRGADGAPSLRIDRVAEEAVLRTLDYGGTKIDVLSEEAGFVRRGGDRLLVLDPIDGTHNAIRGVPAYSVSMAIGTDRLSDVEEGLVRDLVTGATYYAARGRGAALNGRPIRTRPSREGDLLIGVYIGKNADPSAARVAARARRVRHLGAASLDMCLVAHGASDLYYMHSATPETKLRVVDIAASTLVVREAGGRVTDLGDRDLDIPLRPDARTDLIAFGDPRAREAIR
ncbi:MAG TPA: inositol monophosphatase family protein [Thermoplasmata archaeon]|nr:inositol monophosphatase family protein [Thermoplasmata archaeon]